MDRDAVVATIEEIFQDVLDEPTLALKDEHTANDIDNWDSLTHIGIVSAIEKEYGIKFALGELDGLKNVGEMINAVMEKTS